MSAGDPMCPYCGIWLSTVDENHLNFCSPRNQISYFYPSIESNNMQFIDAIEYGGIGSYSLGKKLFLRQALRDGFSAAVHLNLDALDLRHYIFEDCDDYQYCIMSNIRIFKDEFDLYIIGITQEDVSNFVKLHSKHIRFVDYYFLGCHGPESSDIQIDYSDELILPDLYGNLNIDLLCEDFMNSRATILILQGQPGVGKTTLVKYLLNKFADLKSAYIKDQSTLKNGQLWAILTGRRHDLLLLDDLDLSLTRQSEDAGFINELLSFSDGVLGKKTKIIITTNSVVDEIDHALVRPGRCFDYVTLLPLSREQALDIWCNHLGHAEDEFTLQDKVIYQSDLMQLHFSIENKIPLRRYLPEDQRMTTAEFLAKNKIAISNQKFGLRSV